MITVIHPGTPYTSFGISNIIKAILDNPDSLLTMVRVTKTTEEKDGTRDYSWAAVFREPGTIGQIVVLVNQWGTSFGPSAGGTSSALYGELMSCMVACAAATPLFELH